ncbi:MAG: chemotaxis protein CheX [Nakamurella sp.]
MTETISPALPSSVELGEIVEQVWSSFLDGEIISMPGEDAPPAHNQQMVASVSISGDWTGHLMIVTGKDCAELIASNMFQMEPDEISTAEVADAIGEIANMVGGSVKGMVGVAAALSLPQVVLDASALVNLDARKVVSVSAQWNGHPVEISLWERSTVGRSETARKGA